MPQPANRPKPTTVLLVLDGWGIGAATPHNAIHVARTPHWDRLWASAATTQLNASGGDVGLPEGQMGNSEVGHMTLGAGRIIHQDLTRIDRAIDNGEFEANRVLHGAIAAAERSSLHVLGLLSPGGVHSHQRHIAQFLGMASRRRAKVRLHAFLDGRDTPPKSALESLRRIERGFPGAIASICGRYYGMDRDLRWQRTERAYDLVQRGEAPFHCDSPVAALQAAYERGESDEFVQPTAIHPPDAPAVRMRDGDAVVFMNFRADRARQLVRAFVAEEFDGFQRRSKAALAACATLCRYADDIDVPAAFPPQRPADTFGECLDQRAMTQLRLAETEKYAHVTYFFSGGREQPFNGEDRILVPSPKAATYDLAPAMSVGRVTEHLIEAIEAGSHDVIVCNYANGDMVGHSGVFAAALEAVEAIDECLGKLASALASSGSQCLLTADHGNVERMVDADRQQPHTAHTSEPVPLIYLGPRRLRLRSGGTLADVAPTLLELLDIPAPAAMTGRSLLAPVR